MAFRTDGRHISGEDLTAYVDEQLPARETARVYAHLQTCDACRAMADDMRAVKATVRQMPIVPAPRSFMLGPEFDVQTQRPPAHEAPRRWLNFMPAAAMSAAVLMLLVFVDLSTLGSGSDDPASSGAAQRVEEASKASSADEVGRAGSTGSGFAPTPVAAMRAEPAQSGTPRPLQALPQAAPPGAPPPGATPGAAPQPAQAPGGGSPVPANPAGGAAPVPTPARDLSAQVAEDGDGGGLSTLRLLQIIAAVALAGSLIGLYVQKRRAA